jgi:opacity protein-like surface antigen
MVEMSWLATIRGHVGYAVDWWLIYATGGIALTDGPYRNYDFCNNTQADCGSGLWMHGVERPLDGPPAVA